MCLGAWYGALRFALAVGLAFCVGALRWRLAWLGFLRWSFALLLAWRWRSAWCFALAVGLVLGGRLGFLRWRLAWCLAVGDSLGLRAGLGGCYDNSIYSSTKAVKSSTSSGLTPQMLTVTRFSSTAWQRKRISTPLATSISKPWATPPRKSIS